MVVVKVMLLFLLGGTLHTASAKRVVQVYNQELTTNKYLYYADMPELTEFTICFWFNMSSTERRKNDYLISIARPDQGNELLIGWENTREFVIVIQDSHTRLPLCCDDMDPYWEGWRKHCFSWKSDAYFKWYVSNRANGEMELISYIEMASGIVRAGGYMTLLQEQDNIDCPELDESPETIISRGKQAKQSSTMDSDKNASMAIDGIYLPTSFESESLAHTMQEMYPWWRVDLGAINCVYEVRILNRANGSFYRLRDVVITVAPKETELTYKVGGDDRRLCNQHRGLLDQFYTNLKCKKPMKGRFVQLTLLTYEYLNLYEVDVYGSPVPANMNGGSKLDIDQTIPGQLAEFNMWDYEMTFEEIKTQTCGNTGNIITWSTLNETGEAIRSHLLLPDCKAKYAVYHQELTTEKYLYQTGLPEMSQLTTCFWLKLEENVTQVDDYLISIAHLAEANEFLVGWDSRGTMLSCVQNYKRVLPLPEEVNSKFVGWHRHCFSWKSSSSLKWYVDWRTAGHVELVSATEASNKIIRKGGHLILLQDQDFIGTKLDMRQTVNSQLAEFNIWSREMAEEELNSLACSSYGDVSSWITLKEKGHSYRSHRAFLGCSESPQSTSLHVPYNTELSSNQADDKINANSMTSLEDKVKVTPIAVGTTIGVVLLIGIILLIIYRRKLARRYQSSKKTTSVPSGVKLGEFSRRQGNEYARSPEPVAKSAENIYEAVPIHEVDQGNYMTPSFNDDTPQLRASKPTAGRQASACGCSGRQSTTADLSGTSRGKLPQLPSVYLNTAEAKKTEPVKVAEPRNASSDEEEAATEGYMDMNGELPLLTAESQEEIAVGEDYVDVIP